ncbi:arrestin domain-containing protein [Aspergillus eucalypticola CBS 122712]|uniref:Arrestin domain-containing protein n=1 Tax=Aspergillus eucalypticola (strain CBS 122712 / IBT 29274) TaxID=1448314 RepID=A0A317VMT1_ASPEC|nr:arrestin domain-containing protein [Aspergillus eucalypticola CBS 122712]PWY74879.1 arrestin domain-containing protein [Aspergillus eucalypticola CBS 122712]
MAITSLFRAASPPENAPTCFGIRLDSDIIWLPGDSSSTGYCHVTGKVVLCLNQSLCVKDIKLHFEGRRYMNWQSFSEPQGAHHHMPSLERLFMYQTWSFLPYPGTPSPTTLPAGNHEFPFTFCLSNSTPDTIEGLGDCHARYQLKAMISTVGGRRIHANTRVRVRRMYRSLLLPEPKIMQEIWPQKIIYRVSLPSQAYIFGSVVPIKFEFIPSCKRLEVATIHTKVEETHRALQQPVSNHRTRIIVKDDYYPRGWDEDEYRITSDNEGCWYSTTRFLHLPSDPKECLQSISTNFLRVEHTLTIQVKLLNPDGHHSAVLLDMPISIQCALPPLLEDPFVCSVIQSLRLMDETFDQPLPSYNNHVMDRTPDEIAFGVPGDDTEVLLEPPSYCQLDSSSKPPSYESAVISAFSNPALFNEGYA